MVNDKRILCGNCSHPIIQDEESGKWFHEIRDTKDACNYTEKNNVCKCVTANPFSSKPKIETPLREKVSTPVIPGPTSKSTSSVVETVDDKVVSLPDTNMPVPHREENPINRVLVYLLEERQLATADACFVLDLCKFEILNAVKKTE